MVLEGWVSPELDFCLKIELKSAFYTQQNIVYDERSSRFHNPSKTVICGNFTPSVPPFCHLFRMISQSCEP